MIVTVFGAPLRALARACGSAREVVWYRRAMTRTSLFALALSLLVLPACAEVMIRSESDDTGRPARDAGPETDEDAAFVESDAALTPPDAFVPEMPDAYTPPAMPCPRVRVNTPGEALNVRPTPSTSMPVVGVLPHGALVDVVGMVRGEAIGGVDLWYEIRSSVANGFVFSSFAVCTTDEPPADGGYFTPFACGARMRVTQSPGGGVSHTGRAMYAYDFAAARETAIHAMRGGTVTFLFLDTGPGDACYDGGGSSCGPYSNLVIVQHADGTTAVYKHINSATVSVGQVVRQGDVIARSGNTGYSTGPHLHAEVRAGCPTTIYCDTIPFSFADIGSPSADTTITSGNCP